MKRFYKAVPMSLLVSLAAACGGGSIDSSNDGGNSNGNDNVLALSVNPGPQAPQVVYANGLFTSVTVCVPGTSNCQTVDNVLVDSGSYGLRLLGSAVTAITLPTQTNVSGNQIAECAVFADGYAWGPVVTADIHLANETAGSMPVHLIGAAAFASAPSACTNGAGQAENSLATLGSNGILGIGVFAEDCGTACTTHSDVDLYFACNGTSQCTSTTQALAQQVQNPVALFASDNNGVLLQLPSISSSGAQTVSGSMIFGIGTRSNNGLGSARVLTTNGSGEVSAQYNGSSYPKSFIDSGSNGLFFSDSSIPTCSSNADFYCPTSTLNLTAELAGQNGISATAPFSVASAQTLFNSGNTSFNDLAGTTGSTLNGSFDFGLPFFFGRTIYFALENRTTPGGPGPYFAY